MPLTFTYSDPQGVDEPTVNVSLGSNAVPFGSLSITEAAELGETGISGLEVDDPDGLWNFVGLRALTIRDTAAGSNNDILLRGRIQDRKVKRGESTRTGSGRTWSIDLVDYNFHLGSRVFVDADAKRPAETAGDRLRWLLTNAAHVYLNDYGHVTYPTARLDANDYRGQRTIDLLGDCAGEDNYNFWCAYNEAHNAQELFFMDPDSSDYASTVSISNDPDAIDYLAVFPPNEDAELSRSATRIAFGVYLSYASGAVYVRNQTTGEQFAKVDQTSSLANIKTSDRAQRMATKFLNSHDEEEDKITCSVWLPPAKVNSIRAGHLIPVQLTHFPGYEAARACRVLRRTIVQDPEVSAYQGDGTTLREREGWYRVDLELDPVDAFTPCTPADDVDFFGGGVTFTAWSPLGGPDMNGDVQDLATGVGGWDNVGSGVPYSGGAMFWWGFTIDRGATPSPTYIGRFAIDATDSELQARSGSGYSLWASDDNVTYTRVVTIEEFDAARTGALGQTMTVTVPAAYRASRYLRLRIDDYFISGFYSGPNINYVRLAACTPAL